MSAVSAERYDEGSDAGEGEPRKCAATGIEGWVKDGPESNMISKWILEE